MTTKGIVPKVGDHVLTLGPNGHKPRKVAWVGDAGFKVFIDIGGIEVEGMSLLPFWRITSIVKPEQVS